ncbi:MAG: hypothetical protein ACKVJJ_05205 [Fidelibacterota bacterium]|jgi:TolB-like protein
MSFFAELKRRKVTRVAGTYALVAWILMQIGEVTFPALNIPEWIMSTLVVILLAGFPIAVIFAWIFDKTPQGLIKTDSIESPLVQRNAEGRQWFAKKRTYFTAAGILLGILIGAIGPKLLKNDSPIVVSSDEIQKLAILPFSNIRPDEETDFLGYALSDEIINRLGYLKSLIVRPSTAVRQYRGKEVSPEEIGEDLEVNLILTGSYLRDADRLRLNTELMDIRTKELIWQKSMTVDYNDIFAIQDSVAGAVIHGLKGQLSPEDKFEEKEFVPKNPKAYELYLKAKTIENVLVSNFSRKIALLNKSVKLDDEFAPAWAALGLAHHRLGNFGVNLNTNIEKSEIAFLRSLQIDSSNKQAFGNIIALYTDQNRLIEAYSFGNRGLSLYPNDGQINTGLGYAVRYAGLIKESIQFNKKALTLEFNPYEKVTIYNEISRGYFYLGHVEKGRNAFDELLNYIENENIEMSSYAMFYDGMADLYIGKNKEAFKKFDLCYEFDPTQIFTKYGQIYKNILAGNDAKALELINALNKLPIYDGEQYYRFIQFYAMLNMPDEAIEKMEGTFERGFYPYPYYQSDKFLDNIRNEPGYQEVLKKIKAKHIEFKTLFESTMDKDILSKVALE